MFSDKSKFNIKDSIVISSIADEMIILDTNNGKYLQVNSTGKFIFENIQINNSSFNEITIKFINTFEVSQAEAESELSKFLDNLIANELINEI